MNQPLSLQGSRCKPDRHAGLDPRRPRPAAFTLVELLISMTILSLILILLTNVLGVTQKTFTDAQSKVEQFREARVAFESITRRLSQATLNTYWDYNDPENPTRYLRQSELHFLSGPATTLLNYTGLSRKFGHAVFFQAPMGVSENTATSEMKTSLNAWGYYLTYDTDTGLGLRPGFIPGSLAPRSRCRLMEFREPTERLKVYTPPGGVASGFKAETSASFADTTAWYNNGAIVQSSRPIAENIIALVISARSPVNPSVTTARDYDVAPDYYYDSRRFLSDGSASTAPVTRNQLPPTVRVTMVALDERSADKYERSGRLTADLVPTSLFTVIDEDQLEKDLASLTERLIAEKLTYQVFNTAVTIRAARWSAY